MNLRTFLHHLANVGLVLTVITISFLAAVGALALFFWLLLTP